MRDALDAALPWIALASFPTCVAVLVHAGRQIERERLIRAAADWRRHEGAPLSPERRARIMAHQPKRDDQP